MGKLYNSLRYGSSRTKRYIWIMLVCTIASAGLLLYAIWKASLLAGGIGLFLGIMLLVVYQSTTFQEVQLGQKGKKEQKVKKDTPEESREKREAPEVRSKEETVERTEKKQEETVQSETRNLDHYGEREIKQLLIKYKVKKEHRHVLIDQGQPYRISQCPAYIWRDRQNLCLLLLEEEPRSIKIPANGIFYIGYEKGIPVKKEDYSEFQGTSLVAAAFAPLLPRCYDTVQDGKAQLRKNLFTIKPGIKVTNYSARALFDLLEVDFRVEDEVTRSTGYDDYYKMVYQENILWKNEVISAKEYQSRIKVILLALAQENISQTAYLERLEQMVRSHFITEEYAVYYKELERV